MVVLRDGVLAANDDVDRPTLRARSRDLHTGYLALHLLDDVLRARGVELLRVELLGGGAQLALLDLTTEARDDHLRQLDGGRFEREVLVELTPRQGDRDGARHVPDPANG